MKQQARSYLEMQAEEPKADSGRYRIAPQAGNGPADDSILASFKRVAFSLGLDLGQQTGVGQHFEIRKNAGDH